MSDTFKGRVAIVTGAARGIGAAIAEALLQNECKVCLADVLEQEGLDRSKELKAKYGDDRVCFRATDVTNQGSFEGAFEETIALWGSVTILVSNAGVIDEADYVKLFDVNSVSCLRAAYLALRYMGKDNGGQGGNVLFTASILGLFPCGPVPAYSASKFAVVALAKIFAHSQYERSGIRFAALCPGPTTTPLGQIFIDLVRENRSAFSEISDAKGMEGISTPELIAGGAIQLLKDNRNGSVLIAHCGIEGHYCYVNDSHFDPASIMIAAKPAQ